MVTVGVGYQFDIAKLRPHTAPPLSACSGSSTPPSHSIAQSFGTASPPNVFGFRTIWGDSDNQCQAEAIEDNRSTLFGAICNALLLFFLSYQVFHDAFRNFFAQMLGLFRFVVVSAVGGFIRQRQN